LSNPWNKCGESNFKFEVLIYCEPVKKKLLSIEQQYIDLKSDYNISKVAGSRLGTKASEETKRKLSEIGKNRKYTQEQIDTQRGKRYRSVLQICPNTFQIINNYKSLVEASKNAGCAAQSISHVASGKRFLANAYTWLYEKDYSLQLLFKRKEHYDNRYINRSKSQRICQ